MRFLIQLGFLISLALTMVLAIHLAWAFLDEEASVSGLAFLILLLSSVLSLWLWRADERRERSDDITRLKAEIARRGDGGLMVGNSWKAYVPFAFVLSGLLAINNPEFQKQANFTLVEVWLANGFGGMFLWYDVWLWIRQWGRPRLCLDSQGLDHFLLGRIDWAEVDALAFHVEPGDALSAGLALALSESARKRVHSRAPWVVRLARRARLARRHSPGYVRISLDDLDVLPLTVMDTAWKFRLRVDPKPLEWDPQEEERRKSRRRRKA